MPVLLFIALFLSIEFEFDLTKVLAKPKSVLHNKCISLTRTTSHFSGVFESFICGKKLENNSLQNLFIKANVYHLIVVSAGHFLLIEQVLLKLNTSTITRIALMFIYYIISGLQAPGLRAFVSILLSSIKNKYSLDIHFFLITFYSGIICLILNFSFWNSISFWLSFNVSLTLSALSVTIQLKDKISEAILKQFLIYLVVLPFLISKSYTDPINILLGTFLLGPTFYFLILFGVIHFFYDYFPHSLASIFDTSISIFFSILEKSTQTIQNKNNTPMDWFILWSYLFFWALVFHFLIIQKERDISHV